MPTRDSWNRHLSPAQAWCACLLVMLLQVLPLILADYPYMDDLWRAGQAGNGWSEQGRVLTDLLYAVLGFSAGAPDIFPLPLLLATALAAWALADLARHYFAQPRLTSLLVVLPLWLNPFLLQNLSYQYDGAAMALALACSVWAITWRSGQWHQRLVGVVLVAAGASFYQLSVNVFAGLCCIELVRAVQGGASLRQSVRLALGRLLQLVGGGLLYLLSAYQLVSVPRTALLALDAGWWPEMLQRLAVIAGHVQLLATPVTLWVFVPLLVLAGLALGQDLLAVARRQVPALQRLALATLLLLAVLGAGLLVYGLMFVFAFFDDGARMLIGFGPLLVLLALLVHRLLEQLPARPAWLLAVPCLFMLSFSFAYGRVLVLQKQMHQALALAVAEQLQRMPELAQAQALHVVTVPAGSRAQWLPAAEGSFRVMPALRYVLNINYLMLPEMLPRYGVTGFSSLSFERWQAMGEHGQALVSRRFFDIYQHADSLYVVMKTPQGAQGQGW